MRKVLVMMDELVKDEKETQCRFLVKNKGQVLTVTLDKGNILNPDVARTGVAMAVDTVVTDTGLTDAGHTGVRG